MKRIILVPVILLLVCVLSSCSQSNSTLTAENSATAALTEESTAETTETEKMNKITITVGDKEFTATLYDNEAAKEFASRLPLTLDMNELHGNEKYYYFDSSLPTDSAVPDRINSGDIKLFGSDCLVLFYDSFTTSYSYTDIGKADNPSGLKEALGNSDVTVTFSVKD